MNKKQFSKVLKLAMPEYKVQLRLREPAYMCNVIERLHYSDHVSFWEGKAAVAKIAKLLDKDTSIYGNAYTLAVYLLNRNIPDTDENKIAFWEEHIL